MSREGQAATTESSLAGARRPGVRGRLGAAVAGQAVASGSNLIMSALAARELSVSEFGVFGVVYTLNIALTGIVRALIGEPTLVRSVGRPDVAPDVYSSGVLFALMSSSVLVTSGMIGSGAIGAALIAFGVVLPGMVIQDIGRYLAFADLRPTRALALDLSWAVLQVSAVLVLVTTTEASAAQIVLMWGGTGSLVGLGAVIASRNPIQPPSFRWIRSSWMFAWRYLVGFLASAGVVQATMLTLGSIEGVAAVGSVRGAQLLLGPLIPLYAGASAVLVPEGAGTRRNPARFERQLIGTSVVMASLAALLTIGGLLLPDAVGQQILGESWAPARRILLPAGLASMVLGAAGGPAIGLRAIQEVRAVLALQLWMVPIQLVLPVVGAVWAGTPGFMWGSAVAASMAALMWWHRWILRAREASDGRR